jgi:hypothetical protein
MSPSTDMLPEGTDHVINGASVTGIEPEYGVEPLRNDFTAGQSSTQTAGTTREKVRAALDEKAAGLKDQATDKARYYATQGLDKATTTLDDVVKLVDDAAAQIDERVGAQYGDYARRASSSISGLAETLRGKDVDALFADARDVVRKSPAIAIGAAAALGFVVARILKAGTAETCGQSASTETPAAPAATIVPVDSDVPVAAI